MDYRVLTDPLAHNHFWRFVLTKLEWQLVSGLMRVSGQQFGSEKLRLYQLTQLPIIPPSSRLWPFPSHTDEWTEPQPHTSGDFYWAARSGENCSRTVRHIVGSPIGKSGYREGVGDAARFNKIRDVIQLEESYLVNMCWDEDIWSKRMQLICDWDGYANTHQRRSNILLSPYTCFS